MKLKKNLNSGNFGLFLALLIVLLDLFLQYYFRSIGFGVENLGLSFGIASGLGLIWKIFPTVLFLLLISYELYKKKVMGNEMVLLCIGGLGNLVSRVVFGSVWDYLNIGIFGLWVNLSDIIISFSVLSYILTPNES